MTFKTSGSKCHCLGIENVDLNGLNMSLPEKNYFFIQHGSARC